MKSQRTNRQGQFRFRHAPADHLANVWSKAVRYPRSLFERHDKRRTQHNMEWNARFVRLNFDFAKEAENSSAIYRRQHVLRSGLAYGPCGGADGSAKGKISRCPDRSNAARRLVAAAGWTGPLDTSSGGAPAESPQGQSPPSMQAAPEGSSKTIVKPRSFFPNRFRTRTWRACAARACPTFSPGNPSSTLPLRWTF